MSRWKEHHAVKLRIVFGTGSTLCVVLSVMSCVRKWKSRGLAFPDNNPVEDLSLVVDKNIRFIYPVCIDKQDH